MTKKPIRVGVLGAGGRMGQAIIGALSDWPGLTLAGAVERAGHASCGRPAGPGHPETLTICSNVGAIAHKCDVLIDFSVPAALAVSLEAAQELRDPALLPSLTEIQAQFGDEGDDDFKGKLQDALEACRPSTKQS